MEYLVQARAIFSMVFKKFLQNRSINNFVSECETELGRNMISKMISK